MQETNGSFWEERLLRPIDIYPEYRRAGRAEGGEQVDDKHLRLVQYFLDIETDEVIVGRAGPVGADVPRAVMEQIAAQSVVYVDADSTALAERALRAFTDSLEALKVRRGNDRSDEFC